MRRPKSYRSEALGHTVKNTDPAKIVAFWEGMGYDAERANDMLTAQICFQQAENYKPHKINEH
jgi:hypothetical protein